MSRRSESRDEVGTQPEMPGRGPGIPPPRRLASGAAGTAATHSQKLVRRDASRIVGAPERRFAPTAGGPRTSQPPPEPPLLRYLNVLKRRWRTGLLLFLLVVSGVTAGVLLQTPLYRAAGLLEVRQEGAAAVPVESLFSPEKVASDDLETQYGILRSQRLAERVLAAVANYYPRSATTDASSAPRVAAGPGATAAPSPVVTPDDIDRFERALVVNPQKGSRLVEVAFSSPDAKLAAFTVNSLLDNYLQLRMEEAQQSAAWLEAQLADAQRRLGESERQLQVYIREHGLQVVETGKGETAQVANERLQALHEALARAQTERIEKQSASEEARRLAASRDVDSPVVQTLSTRLADLRREHAKLSSVFKEDYPSVRALNDQIAEVERALAEESRFVVTRGRRDYEAAMRKEALLRKALDEQGAAVQALSEQSAGNVGYQALKRDLVSNQDQFAALSQKLKEVSISAALKAANVGIVDRAKPPIKPDGMPIPLTIALAGMVGLFVGVGGIFVREHLDTSMRTQADVEAYLGVRTLGAIPAVRPDRMRLPAGSASTRGQWRRIDEHGREKSPLAEAFATLRNAVLLDDRSAASRVLLVTSAQSEEGKTTISVNLALSLARLNYRVLLVDGNMRYPCVQQALGLPDRPGLVDYLAAGVEWRSCVHPAVQPNLDVLAGAEPQESPADLLSLPLMGELLDAAARRYDFVVVDSPALLAHPADVHALAAVVDDVLFTVRQGSTRREAVSLALSQLERVSGVVLNRFNASEITISQQV